MRSLTLIGLFVLSGAAVASGDAPFCVYSNAPPQCFYYDIQSCRNAAATFQGMCAPNQRPPAPVRPVVPPISYPSPADSFAGGYLMGAAARQSREEHEARMEVLRLQAEALRAQQSGCVPQYYLCPDLETNGETYVKSETDGLGCAPVY